VDRISYLAWSAIENCYLVPKKTGFVSEATNYYSHLAEAAEGTQLQCTETLQ